MIELNICETYEHGQIVFISDSRCDECPACSKINDLKRKLDNLIKIKE